MDFIGTNATTQNRITHTVTAQIYLLSAILERPLKKNKFTLRTVTKKKYLVQNSNKIIFINIYVRDF